MPPPLGAKQTDRGTGRAGVDKTSPDGAQPKPPKGKGGDKDLSEWDEQGELF